MSVLDAEERAALQEAQATTRHKDTHPISLLSDETRVRGQISSLELQSEEAALRLSLMLTRERRRPTTFAPQVPTLLTPAERTARLTDGSFLCHLLTRSESGASGHAILLLSRRWVFESVERAFGGKGTTALSPADLTRSPSTLEQRMAAKIATRLTDDLSSAGHGVWPSLRMASVLQKPEHAVPHLGQSGVLSLAWSETSVPSSNAPESSDETPTDAEQQDDRGSAPDASEPDTGAKVTLLLPTDVLDSPRSKASPLGNGAFHNKVASHLRDTLVDLVVELGRANSSLEGLLSLAPGDVVRLDKTEHDELDALVDGQRVLVGRATAEGSQLAIKVSAWSER